MKLSYEKRALYLRIREDLAALGARILLLSPPDEWPQVYSIVREIDAAVVRIYIWNLTYDTARGDFKFQLTGVDGNQFDFAPGARVVILGYLESSRLYLAADSDLRTEVFGSSPAIQTTRQHLDDANRDGMKAFTKERTGEVAVVFRHDILATYLLQAGALHSIGRRNGGLLELNSVVAEIGAAADQPALTTRDRETVTLVRVIRSTNFMKRVIAAYDYRCCVCDVQLDLIEAAHIVPAGADLSSDDTRNGLCLCANHHQAYDDGLLGVHPDYSISISSAQISRLASLTRKGGLIDFRARLRPSIAVPYDPASRPDPDFLHRGLAARNWQP